MSFNEHFGMDKELKVINAINEVEENHGKSSAFRASFNVICTVVGAGLLSLPKALEESGWGGLIFLLGIAVMSCWTAIILIECLNPPETDDQQLLLGQKKLITYGDIGDAAFGFFGRLSVDIFMHITLVGVATVYLVLIAQNFQSLITDDILFPPDGTNSAREWFETKGGQIICTLIAAALVSWHIFFKTMHEIGIVSALNVLVAVFLALLVIISVFTNPQERSEPEKVFFKSCESFSKCELASAFVTFAFAYGAHPILPSVYASMEKKEHYNKMIMGTFSSVLCFYLPMAIIGYWAYGADTASPIYDNLCPPENLVCSTGERVAKIIAIIAITLHVIFSYGVVINTSERALEGFLKIDEKSISLLLQILIRIGFIAVTFGLAIAIPDFGTILDLVSSLTNTFTCFIFPCCFYLKLFNSSFDKKKRIIVWIVNIIIMSVASIGGVIGFYNAIYSLIPNDD
eukprot:TRINITY_DN474_c4_g1_i1.p1 TRINITY_DN474_c4_g1~~TRINITY_DN474_c4_g1_i1.p1  ORF type:complete len:460 (-),score=196.92 TRINITY_DN474_c4_g1_i1:94-1473(-)